MILTNEQLERYSRQMILYGIGGIGQEKLFKSKVLVVGVGGLGSAVLFYLSGCGVGTLGIVDYDRVELSNLSRQIIHSTNNLNTLKTISAKARINALNPDVNVVTFNQKLNENNIQGIVKDFEIVVDGLDNFECKFLLNEYSILLGKKLVHGGVIGFEGQVLTIIPNESACLRCFFPDKGPATLNQSCKEQGVLGSCVGVIGTIMANEVVKLILKLGKPLVNKVLKFNALEASFYEFDIRGKNVNCPICSKVFKPDLSIP